MIINKLTATFGVLENRELELNPRLNIIEAPNESGKTTWCSFISAMLFGLTGNERKKAGFIPDRIKYIPRSGVLMTGKMEADTAKGKITIERSSITNNQPFSEFNAFYTDTKIVPEGITADNCGEKLTGVSRNVFRRTAFVPQGYVSGVSGGGVEDKIRSVVTTGDEDVSFDSTDERLRSWLRERKYNNTGEIPDTERAISECEEKLDSLRNLWEERGNLASELDEIKQKIPALEADINDTRKKQRRESIEMLTGVKDDTVKTDNDIEKLKSMLSDMQGKIRNYNIPFKDRNSLIISAKKDLETVKKIETNDLTADVISKHTFAAILSILVAMALLIIYLKNNIIIFPIFAIISSCVAVFFTILGVKKFKKTIELREIRDSILEKYGVKRAKDINKVVGAILYGLNDVESIKDSLNSAQKYREELDKTRADVEAKVLSALDMTDGTNTASDLNRELQSIKNREQQITNRISAIDGQLGTQNTEQESELELLLAKKKRLTGEYNAIQRAIDVLNAANAELAGRFSPMLGEKAGDYLSVLTGGRYTSMRIDKNLSVDVTKEGDIVASEPETLSAGTMDQVYLAVRLAVCSVALDQNDPCPLIIDDALVNFDGERYDRAIELLREIAKERQVILFTCRGTNTNNEQS